MDTALIIVLIVAALVFWRSYSASQRRSVRQREQARAQADEHRTDAKLHQTRAERERSGRRAGGACTP